MSHASHQEHEQTRRDRRHADMRDQPEEPKKAPRGPSGSSKRQTGKHDGNADETVKGTAPAAPPRHEDEAFRIFEGNSPQSDG